jgi:MtN3 and saliva related transmembrane protein
LAAVLTTSAFFPQVLRTWRLRSEKHRQELSWTMLILFGTGVGLWFVYGYFRASGPIMLANGATGILILAIVVIKAWRH